MLVCTYWTDDRYAAHAHRMLESARRVGLPTYGEFLPNQGTWQANNYLKPTYLRSKLDEFGRPLLWVDADAIFRGSPDLLLDASGFDVAAYYSATNRPWAGTLYLQCNDVVRGLLDRWVAAVEDQQPAMDQDVLPSVLAKSYNFRALHLPPAYCWVESKMRRHYPKVQPVIEHLTVAHPNMGVS